MSDERKSLIKATVTDLVSKFLYYDRKEDEELPRGDIENAINSEEVTLGEVVSWFSLELEKGIESSCEKSERGKM